MSSYYLAVAVLASLSVASIALSFLMWMRLQRLEAQLLPERPKAPVAEKSVPPPVAEQGEVSDKFSNALMGGEMNLRLAQETREPPEKYRFVCSLSDQGMEAAEIAKTLHLSQEEVEQLLTLGRLGRRDADSAEQEAKETDGDGRKG